VVQCPCILMAVLFYNTLQTSAHVVIRVIGSYCYLSIVTEVYFCHQNQKAKYIGNFTTLLKPHSIGTHLLGIEMRFQVVPLLGELYRAGNRFRTRHSHFS
jgi:hypothetical protein